MTFHVGQKVVCVVDNFDPRNIAAGTNLPKSGEIYTVRELMPYSKGMTIRLIEISNPPHYFNDDTGEIVEAAFPVWRFRPLTDQKKSVSFTMGADPDSERWDNRRKVVEPVNALINASKAVSDRFDRRAVPNRVSR